VPVSMSEGFNPRPRLVFAAPLPLGMLAEHELADLVLAERLTMPNLRERLARCLPPGYAVTDLFDVWVGAPALAPQLVAADYRVTLLGVEASALAAAVERLLAAESLPRTRAKENRTIRYDLRPLIHELRAGGGPAATLWMRLRHSQAGGTGRADEVVSVLADEVGLRSSWGGGDEDVGGGVAQPAVADGNLQLEAVTPVRERLWLVGEVPQPGGGGSSAV
jgi:radical SAM-linked protein